MLQQQRAAHMPTPNTQGSSQTLTPCVERTDPSLAISALHAHAQLKDLLWALIFLYILRTLYLIEACTLARDPIAPNGKARRLISINTGLP